MKKNILCLFLICPLLVGCENGTEQPAPSDNNNQTTQHHPDSHHDYYPSGVFFFTYFTTFIMNVEIHL